MNFENIEFQVDKMKLVDGLTYISKQISQLQSETQQVEDVKRGNVNDKMVRASC